MGDWVPYADCTGFESYAAYALCAGCGGSDGGGGASYPELC